MTRYARILDGIVAEVITAPDGVPLADMFHPDLASAFVEAGQSVVANWEYKNGIFSAPKIDKPSLADLKASMISKLSEDCSSAIIGGYSSDALGTSHSYPSGMTDQINMMGSVTSSLLPDLAEDWSTPFWCADSDGNWAFRGHSAAEIQQAGNDGKAHVVACQTTLDSLTAAVFAATTASQVAAISWPAA